jgi:hypothetical protein
MGLQGTTETCWSVTVIFGENLRGLWVFSSVNLRSVHTIFIVILTLSICNDIFGKKWIVVGGENRGRE